ncbi:MAG: hypothetical protein PVG91_00075 [Gammaproteobacteria bacterium]|jgi:hypothetical protein
MKTARYLILLALFLAGRAEAFRVDINVNLEGLEVEILRVDIDEAVVLRVRNYEDGEIRCDFEFRNGPEVARERRVSVEAGKDRVVRWTPSRQVVRVRVGGSCWRSDEANAAA